LRNASPFDVMIRDAKYSRSELSVLKNYKSILEEARLMKKPILFVNSYSCYLASRSFEYLAVFERSICLLDGKPLARIVNKWSGYPVLQTRGIEFFSRAVESLAQESKSQVLFGSTDIRCREISEKLKAVTGNEIQYICPPFQELGEFDFASLAKSINAMKPEVVWVALGTPKQDFVASNLSPLVDASVIAVGAAFDFYAHPKQEAPIWLRATYLEWLFRLAKEPRRLGRRYLIGNPGFVLDYVKWRATRSRSRL
jgi:N-acetylglucosaminyldiphosphoundecaprenol N-acetyl-beta-D-mannosaminyltransferase